MGMIGNGVKTAGKAVVKAPFKATKFVSDKVGLVATGSGLLLFPFAGAAANRTLLINPDATFLQCAGSFWQPLIADPKSILAVSPDQLLAPSQVATGFDAWIEGGKGIYDGWCGMGSTFMRDYGADIVKKGAEYTTEYAQDAVNLTQETAQEEVATQAAASIIEEEASTQLASVAFEEVANDGVLSAGLSTVGMTAETMANASLVVPPGSIFLTKKLVTASLKIRSLFQNSSNAFDEAPLEDALDPDVMDFAIA